MMRFVLMVFIFTVKLCFCLAVLPVAMAQGSIQGSITATEVNGFVVIACFADMELGCNEALSSSTEITALGRSATYAFENLIAGQYLIFLWRDSNANGELEDTQDEVHYYAVSGEEVSLVSPPASNINFTLTSTSNPLTTTPTNSGAQDLGNEPSGNQPSGNQTLVGSWSNYGELGKYLTGNKTAKLDLASSVARTFVFNADGTYSSLTYNENYNDASNSYGPCVWTRVQGIYQTQDNALVTEIRSEEQAYCGLELKAVEITEPLEQFIWRTEENGLGLLDVTELLTVDESYWMSGYAYHVTKDATSSNASPASNPLAESPSQNPLTIGAATESPATTPGSIVGSWYWGTVSSGGYYNETTGIWVSPSGGGMQYTFNADGTYELNFLLQNTFYSCTTKYFRFAKGSYTLEDDVLALTPTRDTSKSEDDCNPSSNYEKDIALATEYLFIQFGRDISEFTGEDLGEVLDMTDLIVNSVGNLEPDPEDPTPTRLSREQ
jgi:uncharacterized protein (DUF2141 family)